MEDAKGEPKKLFYVPLSVKMLLDCKEEECRMDGFDIKSAVLVGRVVCRTTNEKGNLLYYINDNTGAIGVTDYNAGSKSQHSKDYSFKPYGYARVHCVVGKSNELSLEVISDVKDYNEVTNHWLNVVTARCIRKLGVLTEDDLKGAEAMEMVQAKAATGQTLGENEKAVVETIEKMKRGNMELLHEEIYDQLDVKMDFAEFENLVKEMLRKKIIKVTSEKHYDTY